MEEAYFSRSASEVTGESASLESFFVEEAAACSEGAARAKGMQWSRMVRLRLGAGSWTPLKTLLALSLPSPLIRSWLTSP
eukprot:462573-Hanusia_phi.AAC.1